MAELRFDRGGGGLVATREQLDALVAPASAPAELVAELEHAGLLAGGRPIDDLEALVATWSAPLATIDLRMRRDGRDLLVGGVVDDYLAVLLVPIAPGSDVHRVVAVPPSSLPRHVASFAGLGLRARHPDGAAPVPLSWETVATLGDARADPALLADAHTLAEPLESPASVDAVLAVPATRWTLTIAGTANLAEGTLDHQIDLLDPGPAGMWLIVAVPPTASSAAAIPVSTEQVWMLLGSILAVRPKNEAETEYTAPR